MNYKDLTDQIFGKLVELEDSGKRSRHGQVIWYCICECGSFREVPGHSLTSGRVDNCGCSPRTNSLDLTGQRFGKLVAMYPVKQGKRWNWVCQCDCGKFTTTRSCSLKSGKTRSCKCLLKEVAARNLRKGEHSKQDVKKV